MCSVQVKVCTDHHRHIGVWGQLKLPVWSGGPSRRSKHGAPRHILVLVVLIICLTEYTQSADIEEE